MPLSNFEEVRKFHRAIGAPDPDQPGWPSPDRVELRKRLLVEEFREVMDAINLEAPLEEIAKELADLLVVTYGCGAEFGFPMDAVFHEVHASNMQKVGGPVRADGKVLKPPGWAKPDVARVLRWAVDKTR